MQTFDASNKIKIGLNRQQVFMENTGYVALCEVNPKYIIVDNRNLFLRRYALRTNNGPFGKKYGVTIIISDEKVVENIPANSLHNNLLKKL